MTEVAILLFGVTYALSYVTFIHYRAEHAVLAIVAACLFGAWNGKFVTFCLCAVFSYTNASPVMIAVPFPKLAWQLLLKEQAIYTQYSY